MGIDPGTNVLGYAIIQISNKNPYIIDIGVLKFNKGKTHFEKLKEIFSGIGALIDQYNPDEMSIEAPFYGKNVQSMLKLGRAQGAAISAALAKDLDVTEYAPKKIKQSVTGNGNASKEQVKGMLESIFKRKLDKAELDATDALGAAICHHYQSSSILGSKKYSGWKDFIKNNETKVVRGK